MMRAWISLGAAALALGVAIAQAAETNPFLGEWTVTDAQLGPWVQPHDHPAVNASILNAKIRFTATRVEGPQPMGCDRAVFEVKTVPPEYLFEGGLTDPKRQARDLGFTSDTITALEQGCDRPDADIEMSYALVSDNIAVFALDNYIYTMKRTPAR
jgi:hypothetical protein